MLQKAEVSIQGAIFQTGSMLPKLKINIFRSGELFSIQEQRIFISGACSRNKKTIFSKQEQVFNFGSTYFSFWEHAPKNEIFLSI